MNTGYRAAALLCTVFVLVGLAARSAAAVVSIVVNFGSYPSAEAAGHAEKQVHWLEGDTPDCTVCTESFAASELQHYLRKMTGHASDFAISDDKALPEGELILVGSPASNAAAGKLAGGLGVSREEITALGREGYRIKTGKIDGRRVTLIAGGSRAGTLYGVYDLLHRLGCRWFSPAEFDEEVPQAAWNPNFDLTQRPSFAVRGFFSELARGTPQFVLWMARNRLNLWTVLMGNEALQHKLGIEPECGSHNAQMLFLGPDSPYPYNHSRFPQPKLSQDPYPVSELYQGDANHDGKLSYFEAHPEWYAFSKGKRVPGFAGSAGINFCTSNADAVTEFMHNYVQALIDGIYRNADAVEMWMLDNSGWCNCPKCAALGTPTDRNLLIIYRLDQEIKKAQRAGRIKRPIPIRFLAYADVIDPPTRPLPADFDYKTCTATFFPAMRCYVHNFDDAKCTVNTPFQRQLYGWTEDPQRYYRGSSCIGEYYNISKFEALPVCFMHTMAHDIPYYYRMGARQFHYMHVTLDHWGNKSLTNYQMARQLWDVNTDCEALWTDYFARRYGSAAPVMRKYYESLENALSNVEFLKGWNNAALADALEQGRKPLFSAPHLRYKREAGVKCDGTTLLEMIADAKTCRSLITLACAMPLPERIKARLTDDERVFTYAERTLTYYDECVQAYQLAWVGKKEEARPHFDEATRLARLLAQDTWSVALGCQRAKHALAGTMAPNAAKHIAELLGLPAPDFYFREKEAGQVTTPALGVVICVGVIDQVSRSHIS